MSAADIAAPEPGDGETTQCSPNTIGSEDAAEIVAAAREALSRIRRAHWSDWVAVARAVAAGRDQAMKQAGTLQPFGRGYQRAFDEWTQTAGLDLAGIDGPTRAALYQVFDNLDAIEKWRATLTQPERLRLNHPRGCIAKWQSATRVPPPRDPEAHKPAAKGLRSEVMRLTEENDQLRKMAEGEALDPFEVVLTADEETVARALVQRWSTPELRRFAMALIERAEARDRM